MQVELRGIDEIRPYENNPRQNDQAVEAVAARLRQFGFRQPMVVDEAGKWFCEGAPPRILAKCQRPGVTLQPEAYARGAD